MPSTRLLQSAGSAAANVLVCDPPSAGPAVSVVQPVDGLHAARAQGRAGFRLEAVLLMQLVGVNCFLALFCRQLPDQAALTCHSLLCSGIWNNCNGATSERVADWLSMAVVASDTEPRLGLLESGGQHQQGSDKATGVPSVFV